jgi:hypothetical protein
MKTTTKYTFSLVLLTGIFGAGLFAGEKDLKETKGAEIRTEKIEDTLIDVKGKKSLFIGDSHTANRAYGWQEVLCKETGMTGKNTAVGGKNTYWMLNEIVYAANKSFDYCFIYGGANDMYSSTSIEDALQNIKGMIRVCKGNGIKPVVLTGFDPETCVQKGKNQIYVSRYTKFQKMLLDSIKDATVIRSHFVSRSDGDCGDRICHMTAKGHRKMADGVIREMKFKTIK